MRFPGIRALTDFLTTWPRVQAQYDSDYQALNPSIDDVTLSSSTTTTVFYNAKLRPTSNVTMTAKSASAAAESGGTALFIDTPLQGQVSIHHSNSGVTDRIYRIGVTGT